MGIPGDAASTRPAGAAWPRTALASLWVLAVAFLVSSVASSWEGLMARLAGPPTPASPSAAAPAVPSAATAATMGERAIAEARRLGERRDLTGALAALDTVLPQDPAYPFARHLRDQAAEALRSGGRWP
jgi:hypothetical protein